MSLGELSQKQRILAVDDQPDNLFLLEAILDDQAYELTCVDSGKAALDVVEQSFLEQKTPDLILLDVMMPEMDGYEVTRTLRQNENLPYIPILLITAHDQSSVVQGLDAGADDFIRKPFDVNELNARVRSLLRLKKSIDAQAHMIQQRDDFAARLTHDLRTPLVAANRMLELCRDEALGSVADEAKEAIDSIIQNNQNLLDMVNTLLEVYRHEAGQKDLTFSTFNLCDVVDDIIRELRPLAAAKDLTYKCFNVEDAGFDRSQFNLRGDRMELRRVITNLMGNALKFTDSGHVNVQLHQQSSPPPAVVDAGLEQESKSWLVLEVQDTGIGISPEDQATVFERFRQGKTMRSGSGLGLHLAQRIANLHGGLITVSSHVGEGSTFTLYLPAESKP